MQYPLDKRKFYRTLFHLAFPLAVQQLMLASVAACDAFMLGNVTQEQMTAVSLATQIQFVQNMILSAFMAAGSILGAQYWGKKDTKTLHDIFILTLRYAGFISLLFCLGCELIPEKLMLLFTHDETLLTIGANYLRIAGWSYLVTGISQSYLAIMKVTDHVFASAVISIVAVLSNIGLNSLFIFGLAGIPAMGSDGAALATTAARILELLICILISFRKDYMQPKLYRLFKRFHLLGSDFFRQSMKLIGGAMLWGIGFTSYTAVFGHLNSDAAAANSITAVIRDLVCCMCNGIAIAAGIMVGNELGAGNLDEGRAYGYKLKNISIFIGLLSTGIILASIPLLLVVVKLNGTARSYLIGMMIIQSVYMIGRSINTIVINGVFSGGGDTIFDVYSLAVMMWGIAVPLSFLGAFVFNWPVLVVYVCTCLDEVVKIPWVLFHFSKCKWVKNLTRERDALED